MIADPRIEANAVDDLPRVQAKLQGVTVKLVEIGDAHGKVGVGIELDRLGLRRAGQPDFNIGILSRIPKQLGKDAAPLRLLPDYDPGRMQVIVKRFSFAQELRRKDKVLAPDAGPQIGSEAHRNC